MKKQKKKPEQVNSLELELVKLAKEGVLGKVSKPLGPMSRKDRYRILFGEK
jgi:hypothetical protein